MYSKLFAFGTFNFVIVREIFPRFHIERAQIMETQSDECDDFHKFCQPTSFLSHMIAQDLGLEKKRRIFIQLTNYTIAINYAKSKCAIQANGHYAFPFIALFTHSFRLCLREFYISAVCCINYNYGAHIRTDMVKISDCE